MLLVYCHLCVFVIVVLVAVCCLCCCLECGWLFLVFDVDCELRANCWSLHVVRC